MSSNTTKISWQWNGERKSLIVILPPSLFPPPPPSPSLLFPIFSKTSFFSHLLPQSEQAVSYE